ncbi:MAG: hypothetical protein LW823_03865 [Rickettsiales bacterium]|jgi:hypothetical protein|nr:hypothetical protein [Rickettsiales bacterium]
MHSDVDVAGAVMGLIKTVGTACGGEIGQFHTEIGRSITQSVTRCTRTRNENALGKHVPGGLILIDLRGTEQPEAARVLDNIIGQALHESGITQDEWKVDASGGRRNAKEDLNTGEATGREIKFVVPDDKAAAFADTLDKLTKVIRKSPNLAAQCHKGVLCSQEVINQVKGLTTTGKVEKGAVKPYVQLVVPKHSEKETEALAKPAHFILHLEGVPDGMAEQIGAIQNIPTYVYVASGERRSRDMNHTFTGGVNISIPINDSGFDRVISAIKHYKPPQIRGGSDTPQLGALP